MKDHPARVRFWRGAARRAVGFGVLWLVLAEGAPVGAVALGAIAAAVAASLSLAPPVRGGWSVGGVLRFLPFFLRESALGGIDVARRALDPRTRVRPRYLTFPLRLPEGPARPVFAAVVGLLPGTLGVELRGARLLVHALDEALDVEPTLRALEARVADAAGVRLHAAPD